MNDEPIQSLAFVEHDPSWHMERYYHYCSCNSTTASSRFLPSKPFALKPSGRFFPSQLNSPPVNLLGNLIWRRRGNSRGRLEMASSACGSGDENNGFSIGPDKLFMQEAIGAEYGEGFETFRADGPLKVDVDFLNDRLQEGFLQRIRYAMKPDEAYGLIFSWDNVVVDTRTLKLEAWKRLSIEEGRELPQESEIERLMYYASVGHYLQKMLWDESESETDRLKSRLAQLYYDNLLQIANPMEGLETWLDAIHTARIPCAIVSSLDRRSMVDTLERMRLHKYFHVIVSEEDGMESIAHRFLSAALKLDRKPSKCVVFEDDPRGITAAHNCTMMAIALIGTHPAYNLEQADLTIAGFNELSVINLRRLFANKGAAFMDPQMQIIEKSPPKRKLRIDTIF